MARSFLERITGQNDDDNYPGFISHRAHVVPGKPQIYLIPYKILYNLYAITSWFIAVLCVLTQSQLFARIVEMIGRCHFYRVCKINRVDKCYF